MSDSGSQALPNPSAMNLRAALLAALAMCLFSVQDAFVKVMSDHYPVVLILFFRSLGIMPLACWFVWRRGGAAAFRSRRPLLQWLRGLLLFAMFVGYYLALTRLPLATAVSLVFSAPLMTTLLSVPLLKERIGPHRLGAVLVGFVGVLIMVRSGGEVAAWPALLCLGASFAYSLSMVLTRYLGQTESIGTLVFYPNLVFFLGSALLLPLTWSPVSAPHAAVLLSFGLLTFIAHLAITEAYRSAPPPLLAPFDYTTLVWALLWGWLIWSELPDWTTLAGAAVIVLAGLYLLYREARRGDAARAAQPR